MLLSEFIHRASAALEKIYSAPEAQALVRLLTAERLGVQSYTHIVEPSTIIPGDRIDGLETDLSRLASGEPLQYVLGFAEFYSRRFRVNPAVLIPRPETEELVQMALGLGFTRALDLCTGSGCIAWSLSLEAGRESVGVDISGEALDVARSQFDSPLVKFVQADVLGGVQELGKFDLIVSNPPYIMESQKKEMRANVLEHEPELALFVSDSDPLVFYRAVALWTAELLIPGGWGIVEINDELGPETAAVFSSFGDVTLVKDLSGRDRFVRFRKLSA